MEQAAFLGLGAQFMNKPCREVKVPWGPSHKSRTDFAQELPLSMLLYVPRMSVLPLNNYSNIAILGILTWK